MSPDVLLLDVELEGLGGLQVAQTLQGEGPSVRVLGLSVHNNQCYVQELLKSGAAGYFRPFERLHGKNEYVGSGIGLSICRKIVERHGGSLTARSPVGEGAVFIVTLPVHGAFTKPPTYD